MNAEFLSRARRWGGEHSALFLLIALYASVLSLGITEPFWGINDDNAGLFGTTAKNWLAHGPVALNFGQRLADGTWYLDHPQWISFPLALSYWIFGVGEWQTRIVPIAFSLGSLVAFWCLMRLVFQSSRIATGASFFYIFFPTSVYFGRMMSHEPIVRFFILLSFLLLVLFEQTKQRRYLVGFLITLYAGGLMDWPYFFAAFAMWGYVILKKDFPSRKVLIFLIPGIVLASLASTLVQIAIVGGWDRIAAFLDLFLGRARAPTSVITWLVFKITNEVWMFTSIALILAVLGFAASFLRKSGAPRLFIATFLLPGLLHLTVFRGGAFHHGYWSFYLTAPLALLAWLGFERLRARRAFVVGVLFLLLAAWNSSVLFAASFYDSRDIAFLRKTDRRVSPRENICLGQNISQHEISFYFTGDVAFFPCPDSRSFLLKQWEPALRRVREGSYGLRNPFRENMWKTSLEGAVALEFVKVVPFLRKTAQYVLGDTSAAHEAMLAFAAKDASLIRDHELTEVNCSPSFCFYVK